MIRKQQGIDTVGKKVVVDLPPTTHWENLPQPDITMGEFLKTHPIEDLYKLNDEALSKILSPYFPMTRRAMLPTEKPRKMGVANRAVLEAIAANKDAISALVKARNLKV